jgi:hypothetical protein
MPHCSVLRACLLPLSMLALAGCSGERFELPGSNTGPAAAAPSPAPVNLSGAWMFNQPGRGQCRMTFGSAPNASEGTIAPQGGCPGKFYMSRKWTYEGGSVVMRDHNGQPLAQLSGDGAQFNGKATSGEAVTLMR